MFLAVSNDLFAARKRVLSASRKRLTLLVLALGAAVALALPVQAQTQPDTSQSAPQQPPSNPNKQDAPPDAGGPQNDVGPYVIPKKKEEPPPPPPDKPKKIEGLPDYSIRVDVPVVSLDVLVTTKDGQTIPGLKEGNFKSSRMGNRRRFRHSRNPRLRSRPCCWWSSRRPTTTSWWTL